MLHFYVLHFNPIQSMVFTLNDSHLLSQLQKRSLLHFVITELSMIMSIQAFSIKFMHVWLTYAVKNYYTAIIRKQRITTISNQTSRDQWIPAETNGGLEISRNWQRPVDIIKNDIISMISLCQLRPVNIPCTSTLLKIKSFWYSLHVHFCNNFHHTYVIYQYFTLSVTFYFIDACCKYQTNPSLICSYITDLQMTNALHFLS